MERELQHVDLEELKPLDVSGIRTVAVGTALWLVVFVVMIPFHGQLRAGDHLWWLWTVLAGFGLGLFGWGYCRLRKNRLAARSTGSDKTPG